MSSATDYLPFSPSAPGDTLAVAADRLGRSIPCGYHAQGPPASEPTSFAGLALASLARFDAAQTAADWLADVQQANGAVSVTASETSPCWPTSLAMLLWHLLDAHSATPRYATRIASASSWALAERGRPNVRRPHIGHDTSLIGWSWAPNTHSWLEPTAMFVLALKATGHQDHPRTREGVRLLLDRLLPDGGANYGNTFVLGQRLLPHVQPTGLAMLALAGEGAGDHRIERSLAYLEHELPRTAAISSLCFGLMGLSAHGRRPAEADRWLQRAYERAKSTRVSPYRLALLVLGADPHCRAYSIRIARY